MAISYRRHQEISKFHDPMQAMKLIDRITEVRFDPLTGESSRIIYDPGAPFVPPDYSTAPHSTGGAACPFCNENVFRSTPAFPDAFIEGGRMVNGEAVVFPNLFPYGKHSAVVRMSNAHYVRLEQFTVPMLVNSFAAAHHYINKVIHTDPAVTHASLNWNYLPASGGSILHPHVQVLATEQPTRYQALTDEYGQRFNDEHSSHYFIALSKEEHRLQQRWVGRKGKLSWMHAFAPKHHCDFVGIVEDAPSLQELKEKHWQELAESMVSFFQYFQSIGLASFNMALFIPIKPTSANWTHIRLIPRTVIGALGTSDLSVYNYLQGEALSFRSPEKVAKEASVYF